ncbi:MAG: hypothetical protein GF350_10115 [Chitinivibrionales bacterium]|nr:hypothetical protein [Chitinivibrionales bacterium]
MNICEDAVNPASILTLSRLVSAPVFAVAFIRGFRDTSTLWLWLALGFASLIELSDLFDGIVARARKEVTNFGKLVDPMSDSLSRQTVFISFLVCGIIPWWMFLVFLYRDSIMSTMRIMIAYSGTVQAAKISGKIKAVVQATGSYLVIGVCLSHAHDIAVIPRTLWGKHPGFWIMLVPAVVTILSAFDYLVPSWPVIRSTMRNEKPR